MSTNRVRKSKSRRAEAGIALITTLMLMFLMSSLLAGFTILLISNQQLAGSNNDDVNAFYGSEAGMEKMTADLGNLFTQTYAPSISQINALMTTPPSIPGISYLTGSGSSGYVIQSLNPTDSYGNPKPINSTISAGNYQGMGALITQYQLTVTARTPAGREVKLQRLTETVGIPMFQFAIFCEVDCAFHAGANFTIGGRVHGNGNLFLASAGGATLQMQGKVDAYKDIIREYMDNGASVSANWPGTVSVTTNPGGSTYRSLGLTEGSVLASNSACNSGWPTVSTGGAPADYNHNLINGEGSLYCHQYSTGASLLNLGVVTMGGGTTYPVDLIRRPIATESSLVTGERYFAQASLVVLLSDNPADIMSLPCVDQSTQPMDLSVLAQPVVNWPTTAPYSTLKTNMTAYGTVPLPLAVSGANLSQGTATNSYNSHDGYWLPTQAPIIKGYLKIQAATSYAAPCGGWKDVTAEILALGYVGRNINPVPQSLTGTSLNPTWPTVGMTNWPVAGQTCTATACNQMDPLQGNANWNLNNAAAPVTPFNITTVGAQYTYYLPNPGGSQLPSEAGAATSPGTTLYTGTQTCADPHPNAIIRLERVRDNPSSLYSYYKNGAVWVPYVNSGILSAANKPQQAPMTVVCGVDPVSGALATINDKNGNAASWVPQPWDFWPTVLFDTREGALRDVTPTSNTYKPLPTLNGTMQYVELDTANLARWFAGTIGSSGRLTYDSVVSPNDFSVYFSDRRGNYTASQTWTGWPPTSPSGHETGEYGWNDFANSVSDPINGCPNGSLDGGEDLDGTGTFYNYGALAANENYMMGYVAPGYTATMPLTPAMGANSLYNTSVPTAGQIAPVLTGTNATTTPVPYGKYGFFPVANLTAAGGALLANPNCTSPTYANGVWPMMYASASQAARENPPIFFRRALKLVNGKNLTGLGACPSGANCGLAISTENPVYIQGDYNANSAGGGFNDASVGSSVAADAVTILSTSWNDANSFSYNLYAIGAPRIPVNTYYRTAIIGGKGASFPQFASNNDNGTDGGIHNFLRYIEAWGNGGLTVNYLGAIVNLFTNRQATGLFKCCTTVYSVPTRSYAFDSCFLTPSCLPPRTPLFHDVDTTGWTRLQLASQ